MINLIYRLRRRRRRGDRSDAGDTLIEVLVAIVILGIAVTAVLEGLVADIASSGTHRSIANLDAVVKSYSETARYQIQLQPKSSAAGTNPLFTRCASLYRFLGAPVPAGGPPGTTVTVFGSGFSGSGAATVKVNGSTVASTTTTPSGTYGNVTLTFTIPSTATAGSQTITYTDPAGHSASTSYNVTPWVVSLSHASGPVTTSIQASVTGFGSTATQVSSVKFLTAAGSVSVPAASLTNTAITSGADSNLTFPVPSSPNFTTGRSYTVAITDNSSPANTANTTFTVAALAGSAQTYTNFGQNLSGYKVGINAIKYWNGTSFSTSCTTNPSSDEDIQLISFTGTTSGASDGINVVVSAPDSVATAANTPTVAAPTCANSCTIGALTSTLTFSTTVTFNNSSYPTNPGSVDWAIQVFATPTSTTSSPGPSCAPSSLTNTSSGGTFKGTASCAVSPPSTQAGYYVVTAIYSGDPSNGPGQQSSSQSSFIAIVGQGNPTVTVTGSDSNGTVTFTSTVTGTASGITPTETNASPWTITLSGGSVACTSTTALAAAAAQGTATATCSISAAAGGAYTVKYSYGGDSNYSSASGTATLNVATMSLAGLVTSTVGVDTLTLTDTVTPPTGGATPNGTVTMTVMVGSTAVPCVPPSGSLSNSSPYQFQCIITPSNGNTYSATASWDGGNGNGSYVTTTATTSVAG